jgi:hypothetical protein
MSLRSSASAFNKKTLISLLRLRKKSAAFSISAIGTLLAVPPMFLDQLHLQAGTTVGGELL